MSTTRASLQQALGSRYRLEQELGGGGVARVYVAEETSLGRKVVVKVLPPEMAAGLRVERFRREIQLAAQLQHPAIVPLLSAESEGALLWFTMPLVEGQALRARIEESELAIDDVIRWGRDVLEALEHAHARGVVHRDIKPENILLYGRRAAVTDFGVAKALFASGDEGFRTSAGTLIGTPSYMAPEQVRGEAVDARTDLYAAGVVLYEMIAGRLPFAGNTPLEQMRAHAMATPPALGAVRRDVPGALAVIVARLMAKRPDDRYANATLALAALDAVPTSTGSQRAIRPSMVARLRGLLGK